MKCLLPALLLFASSTLLVGCADPVTPAAGATEIVNTHCPVMGGKINPEMTADYDGGKVAFCCPPCLDEWAKMSDEEKKAALEKAASGEGGHGEHGEHAGHSEGPDAAAGDDTENETEGSDETSAEEPQGEPADAESGSETSADDEAADGSSEG